jgi:hypothetical protein
LGLSRILEKSRKFLHKCKRQEQKPSKGYAAQIASSEGCGSEPREEETVIADYWGVLPVALSLTVTFA